MGWCDVHLPMNIQYETWIKNNNNNNNKIKIKNKINLCKKFFYVSIEILHMSNVCGKPTWFPHLGWDNATHHASLLR